MHKFKSDSGKNTADNDDTEDAPQAGNHGGDVSAVAHASDQTPETNHGAYVSAAARANHGQDMAAGHHPDHSGKTANTGKSRGRK